MKKDVSKRRSGKKRKTLADKANQGWNERIGSVYNSPLYTPEVEAAFRASVKEAESMTWEDLKRQAEGCPV